MKKNKSKQSDSDNDFEDIDMDKILNSDDEYSEKERKLLEKATKKNDSIRYDSEEVMGFSNEDYNNEDDDSMASDIEGAQEDFHLPNEKAWGKKKKDYYSTDFVDADYASANQNDIANAELEEKEAKNLQKQLAEQLDETDFGLDLIILNEDIKHNDDEYIQYDVSKLSKRQKQDLFQKESPEFTPLVADFQDRLTEANNILGPFLSLLERLDCQLSPATNFIKAKYDLLLHYCTNISFYLMLKAKKEPISFHPVIKRLAQYRQLLTQLENYQGNILNDIKEILVADLNNKPLWNSTNLSSINIEKKAHLNLSTKSKKIKKTDKHYENKIIFEDDSSTNEDTNHKLDQKMAGNIDQDNEIEKRAITYQIAKNKGLTPHRKKEQRNPRVKHRNKYRKAKIRRRGMIREVRKESTRYGGEISGIKAGVKKSVILR